MRRTARVFAGVAVFSGLSLFAGAMIATSTGTVAAIAQEGDPSSGSSLGPALCDAEYTQGVVEVVLGETTAVSGQGAAVDGTTVRITAAGVYRLSGALADGRIDVDVEGKVYLEFAGVDVTSSSGPALNIVDAKKVTLTLVEGTINRLTDAASDVVDDAALFTNDTLIVNGGGTLIVTGNNLEGISSDDDIIINSGTVEVTAVDDGLNAHDDITINGGEVFILAGGDGLDSNGTVNVNGGTLVSYGGAADGDGGLDATGSFVITGGTIVAAGANVAAPTGDSTQCSIYAAVGAQTAGADVLVMRKGEEVLGFTLGKECRNLLVSSSRFIAGAVYEVYVGDTATALSVTAAPIPVDAGSTAVLAGGRTAGDPGGIGGLSVPAAVGQ